MHRQTTRGLLSVGLPEEGLTAKESSSRLVTSGARQAQGPNKDNLWRRAPLHASSGADTISSRFDDSRTSIDDVQTDLHAREQGASSALLSLSSSRQVGQHQRPTSPPLEVLSSPLLQQHTTAAAVSNHSPFLSASSSLSRVPTSPYGHPVPLASPSYARPGHASHHPHHNRPHHHAADPYPLPYSPSGGGRRTVSPPNSLRLSSTMLPGPGKVSGETAGGKKRRARATQEQLDILNQVYARTPFPSTQERIDLATTLGMTPRSVQIW